MKAIPYQLTRKFYTQYGRYYVETISELCFVTEIQLEASRFWNRKKRKAMYQYMIAMMEKKGGSYPLAIPFWYDITYRQAKYW